MKPILHHAIHVQFKRSNLILGLITLISITSCFILLSLPLMIMIKVSAVLGVIATSIYFCLRDALLMLPSSWQFLTIDTKGNFKITNRAGQAFEPELSESSFIHSSITLLNFKRAGFKIALPAAILMTNSENTDDMRRLRVWLRWGKPSSRNKKAQSQEDFAAATD